MIDLRLVRACLRFSQTELGTELGIDRRRVSEIENGERTLRAQEARRAHKLLARLQPRIRRGMISLLAEAERSGAAQ